MNKQIKDMTGEEIAVALQEQYQTINQCQQNIGLINNELQTRLKQQREDNINDDGTRDRTAG